MARQRNVNRAVEKTGPGPRNEEKKKEKRKERSDRSGPCPFIYSQILAAHARMNFHRATHA